MSPGGWGEGKPQATDPFPIAGTRLSRCRCGTTAASGAWCHSFWSLRGSESRTPASQISTSLLERPQRTGRRVQARGPQITRCPAPPPGGARSPGHQPRATLEGELLAPRFEEFRIPDRRFRPGVSRNLSSRLPGLEEFGLWTPSALTSLFWVEAPTTSRGPKDLGLSYIPSWRLFNSCS